MKKKICKLKLVATELSKNVASVKFRQSVVPDDPKEGALVIAAILAAWELTPGKALTVLDEAREFFTTKLK